jgi:hypothetical protein
MPGAEGKFRQDLMERMNQKLPLLVRKPGAEGKFRHDLEARMNPNFLLLVRMLGAKNKFRHDLDGRINPKSSYLRGTPGDNGKISAGTQICSCERGAMGLS